MCCGMPPPRRELAAPLAQVGEAHDRVDQVVVGGQARARRRRRARSAARSSRLALARRSRRSACGSRGRACRRTPARRSRRPAITSRPRSGSSMLQRVVQPHGDHFVALREMRERLRPARRADEVGHDEHERAALASRRSAVRRRSLQVACAATARSSRPRAASRAGCAARGGGRCAAGSRCRRRRRRTARRRGCRGASAARASTVTNSADTARLRTLSRAEVDRGTRSSRNHAVTSRSSLNSRTYGVCSARGDVPVDVAHVVVVLVFAQVGEIEAEAAEQRAVVAVQQPVEPADHRPLEPAQERCQALRGDADMRFRAACRARGTCCSTLCDELVGRHARRPAPRTTARAGAAARRARGRSRPRAARSRGRAGTRARARPRSG